MAQERRQGWPVRLLKIIRNPLVILLAILSAVSFATGDARAGTVMVVMVVLSVGLRFVQEAQADAAAAKLKAMIHVTATVMRDGEAREMPLRDLVPGDVVQLAAGDMIPGDVRCSPPKICSSARAASPASRSRSRSSTTPRPTMRARRPNSTTSASWAPASRAARRRQSWWPPGSKTYLGGMAGSITEEPPPTSFDQGINRFTWLMIRFMAVMVPLVFVINGLTKDDWKGAFFFAMAVAVGLTPEMLPMIVSVCLSKGAVAMCRKKVIVKRLNAIQNLGGMDVLCTDKTGTLTMDRVILERHCDVVGGRRRSAAALAYLNQPLPDRAQERARPRDPGQHRVARARRRSTKYTKVDEIPSTSRGA